MNPARLASLTSPKSIDARAEFLPGGRPAWTSREIALGCAGLADPYLSAFFFRWSRDFTRLAALERELATVAERLARVEAWPAKVVAAGGERVPFPFEEIVRLALLEEHHARLMSPAFMLAALNLRAHTWWRHVRPAYQGLREEIEVWNSIAFHHIAARLRD